MQVSMQTRRDGVRGSLCDNLFNFYNGTSFVTFRFVRFGFVMSKQCSS